MPEMITTTATLRRLRMSPRKVRLVVALIRGRKVDEALAQLQFAKKIAARPILKLLQSAVANAAHNHQLQRDSLTIKSVTVDGGQILYRWQPRAMGRATPIRKRTSHVTIILEGEMTEKTGKPKLKKKEAEAPGDENTKSEPRLPAPAGNPKEIKNPKS